jgi:hypothetical protein
MATEATTTAFQEWWASISTAGLSRVALLKAIEAETGALWARTALGAEADPAAAAQLKAVVLESNMAGIEEFGARWHACIAAKMDRMCLCADFVALALQQPPSSRSDDVDGGAHPTGFDGFERALVGGAANVLRAYNHYYLAYLATVQDLEVGTALKASPPSADDAELFSSYTAVTLAPYPAGNGSANGSTDQGRFCAAPFASHFAAALAPVLAGFDAWIIACEDATNAAAAAGNEAAADGVEADLSDRRWTTESRAAYVAFLKHYRHCLGLVGSASELEAAWCELDHFWMATKGCIQVVHDIETGYGDPLRVKATPDLSLRFLDDSFAVENVAIADIQARLMAYYESRDTPLARGGLAALKNTLAGIYFIPFKTGISLQFSFSGQSIPNRDAVRVAKGVKIYFDPVETAARCEINEALVSKCFHAARTAPHGALAAFAPTRRAPDGGDSALVVDHSAWAAEQLCWHVAAHEVGHAIYNLSGLPEGTFSNPANESLLEEPRAELTAMFALLLLHEQGVLDLKHLQRSLAHFCLDGLRYFNKYASEALRPYVIFMVYAYKVYFKHNFLSFHPTSGLLQLHPDATLAVLRDFQSCFLALLAAMDRGDGAALEALLFQEMAPETPFVRLVVCLVDAAAATTGGIGPEAVLPPPPPRPERGCTCHPTWSLPTCGVCAPATP